MRRFMARDASCACCGKWRAMRLGAADISCRAQTVLTPLRYSPGTIYPEPHLSQRLTTRCDICSEKLSHLLARKALMSAVPKQKADPRAGLLCAVVRATGIEPARSLPHWNLNPARLPVPPRPHRHHIVPHITPRHNVAHDPHTPGGSERPAGVHAAFTSEN